MTHPSLSVTIHNVMSDNGEAMMSFFLKIFFFINQKASTNHLTARPTCRNVIYHHYLLRPNGHQS